MKRSTKGCSRFIAECVSTTSSSDPEQCQMGLAVMLCLKCSSCKTVHCSFYTSQTVSQQISCKEKPFMVNDLMVLFCNSFGHGHTAHQDFCSIFGIEGMYLKTFQKEARIINTIIEDTDNKCTGKHSCFGDIVLIRS